MNIHEGHNEVDALSNVIKENFGNSVELFVHTDGCLNFSCKICSKQTCTYRKHSFEKSIEWNVENISSDNKHAYNNCEI